MIAPGSRYTMMPVPIIPEHTEYIAAGALTFGIEYRILNDDILLLVPINPDGMELVANWYMRESDPRQRNMNIPRLRPHFGSPDRQSGRICSAPFRQSEQTVL